MAKKNATRKVLNQLRQPKIQSTKNTEFTGGFDLPNRSARNWNGEFENNVVPNVDNTLTLGKSGQAWRELYFGSSGYIDFSNSDVTITYTGGALQFDTGGSGGEFIMNAGGGDVTTGVIGQVLTVARTASVFNGAAIAIQSGTSGTAAVFFGDTDDADAGRIYWNNPQNYFQHYIGSNERLRLTNTALEPKGITLGTSSARWSTIYVSFFGSIDFSGGDVTLDHTFGVVTVNGGHWKMGDDALLLRDVNAGLTASTTQTQGQGALTAEINEISTVANANDTVTLPSAVAGMKITIINNGANLLQIYPASGDDLGAGVNTSTTLAAGANATYCAYDTTNWVQLT